MADWATLVGTIAGAGIGGGIAYLVMKQQHSHELALETNRRQLSNYEAIHEVLSKIAHQAGVLNFGVIGDLGYGSKLKGDILGDKMPTERLHMLVDFYARDLKPDTAAIDAQLKVLARVIGEVLLQKDRGDAWKTKSVETAAIAALEVNKLVEEAQRKLAAMVQPHVTTKG